MIDLTLDADHRQIIDSVRGALERDFTSDKSGGGSSWQAYAAQGWFGLGLSEEAGGSGFSVFEETLLAREFGRALVGPGVLATIVAAHHTENDPTLRSQIIAGDARVGLGLRRSGFEGESEAVHLFDANDAELILIYGHDGLALAGIEALTDRRPVASPVVAMAETAHFNTPASYRWDSASPLVLELLAAAQLVGVAEATRDMAVEYAKMREQFGRAIGSFQAIAHHCADATLRAEAAHAQLVFAAIALRDQREDAAFEISAAATIASDAAFANATINIRIHGGIGYSAEIDAHRYLKQALLLREVAGSVRRHRNQLLDG